MPTPSLNSQRALCSNPDGAPEILRLCQTMLAHTKDMNYIFGLDGRFTYVNRALLTLWGKTFEEAIGLSFAELDYPEQLADRLNQQIQEVILTGQTVTDETPYTSSAGTRFYEYIFIPVFAADGAVEAVAGSTRDVTDRVEAVEAHQQLLRILDAERTRLKDIFHQAPAFFCVLNGPDHICEMANDRFRQITGHRELIGKKIRDAFPDLVGQGFFEILVQVFATGETFTGHDMPVRFQHTAASLPKARTVELVYQPLRDPDGSVVGVLAQGIDLTLRKRAEEELRASEERHRQAAAELAQADRRKDEFLALLAHELRNPLAPLRNAASILQSGNVPESQRTQVHRVIVRQVENMSRMLDDLLDVSRITSGKVDLRIQEIALQSVIHSAADALQSMCARHDVQLIVQAPEEAILVELDETRMEQVLCNLIGNACKYSGDGKLVRVAVELTAGELAERDVLIHIIDDGIGIDRAVLPHVFDLFVQDKRALDRSEGGLAAC